MKLLRSLYARPEIVRGQQCAEARRRGRCWAVVQRRRPGPRCRCRHAEPLWLAERHQTLRPGRGLAAQRLVAGREDVRTPATPVVALSACSVRCADVRVQSVKRTSGVHASGVHASGAMQVCPDGRVSGVRGSAAALSEPRWPVEWLGGRAAPVGAMGSTCRRGPRAAWSPARMGSEGRDGAALAVGGSHEGRWRIWAAVSHAHRLRRRLAAWPTRELVQRQGAGRLAGEHENERVLTSPPAGAFGQVVDVMPDHGAGPGGSDHAPWSLGW